MAKKYLDYDGLLYFWQKIKAIFVSDVTYNSTSRKIQKSMMVDLPRKRKILEVELMLLTIKVCLI